MKSKLHTHLRENNKESQAHLEKNEQFFTDQCLRVLRLLYRGVRLTTKNAPALGIRSLPRRIKDLRDRNGVTVIIDEWRHYKNAPADKVWYINFKRKTKKQLFETWVKKLEKTLKSK